MYNGDMPQSVLGRTGLFVSRLGLGTAELGFVYGIGPRTLPSEEEALALLNHAVERGVTLFDTANYYGLAEERLGRSGILSDERMVVVTKCAQFLEKGEVYGETELAQKIREQVEDSLTKLKLEALPILLLHGPSREQLREGVLTGIVDSLKIEGKVRFVGASTRGEEAPLELIESGWADVIEVAFNIADRRMVGAVFQKAAEKNIGVINRSIYLKGAFAGRIHHLPDALLPLKEMVGKAEILAHEIGVSLPELALRYALSEEAIGSTLVGTAQIANLDEAIEAIEKGPLPQEIVERLSALALSDVEQIDPFNWLKYT